MTKLETELANLKDYGRQVFHGNMKASFSADGNMAWFKQTQKAIDARVAAIEQHPSITEEDGNDGDALQETCGVQPSTPPTRSSEANEKTTAERPLPQTPLLAVERSIDPSPPARPEVPTDAPPTPASPAALTPAAPPATSGAHAAQQPRPAPTVADTARPQESRSGNPLAGLSRVQKCIVVTIAACVLANDARRWLRSKWR